MKTNRGLRSFPGFRALAVTGLLLSGLFAGCAGKPMPGTPEFKERIKKGDIIVWATPVGSKGLNLITAAGAAKASIQGGWDIITDVEKFPEFVFRFERAKVLEVRNPKNPRENRLISFYLDAPWPFSNIDANVEYICNDDTFSCDLRAVEGNVVEMWGGLRLEDWGDGYTYVLFQVFADFGYDNVPSSAINETAEIVIRTWADNIKKRASQEPWVNMPRKVKKAMQPGEIKTEGLDDLMH